MAADNLKKKLCYGRYFVIINGRYGGCQPPKRCFHKKGDCGQGNEKKYYLCTENNPCKNEKAHNNDVLPLGGSMDVPVGSGEGLG